MMKKYFNISGFIAVIMIFWTAIGYLMDLASFPVVLPLCIASIVLFFAVGMLKNHKERKEFRAFLEEKMKDKDLQERLKDERVDPGDKTGRAKVKAYFKDRNTGVTWMPANVHGAVPKRNKKRSFLSKNR